MSCPDPNGNSGIKGNGCFFSTPRRISTGRIKDIDKRKIESIGGSRGTILQSNRHHIKLNVIPSGLTSNRREDRDIISTRDINNVGNGLALGVVNYQITDFSVSTNTGKGDVGCSCSSGGRVSVKLKKVKGGAGPAIKPQAVLLFI